MSTAFFHSSHIDDFVEEGVVVATEPLKAYVMVPEHGACEECSAKIFCAPSSAKTAERTLLVRDLIGVNIGDTVRIAVKGGPVIMAGLLLYGMPLVLLLAGIWGGMALFEGYPQPELLSLGTALALLCAYFTILYGIGKRSTHFQVLPEITQVL